MVVGVLQTTFDLGQVVARGTNHTFTVTVTKNLATYPITGFTITGSIKQQGETDRKVTDFACVVTNGASGIFEMRLTPTETNLLGAPPANETTSPVVHIADFKIVETGGSGDTFGTGLYRFDAVEPVTT